MGVKISGIRELEGGFSQLDRNAKRRLRRLLVKKGRELRDLAAKMAPREHGNLEEAIKLRGDTGAEQARDELGRMKRVDVEVYVDNDMPVPERPGKTVGDYAWEIHTHLEPAGPWKLGAESIEKQGGQTEQVGGGYLDRAAAEVDATIDAALLDILGGIV